MRRSYKVRAVTPSNVVTTLTRLIVALSSFFFFFEYYFLWLFFFFFLQVFCKLLWFQKNKIQPMGKQRYLLQQDSKNIFWCFWKLVSKWVWLRKFNEKKRKWRNNGINFFINLLNGRNKIIYKVQIIFFIKKKNKKECFNYLLDFFFFFWLVVHVFGIVFFIFLTCNLLQ